MCACVCGGMIQNIHRRFLQKPHVHALMDRFLSVLFTDCHMVPPFLSAPCRFSSHRLDNPFYYLDGFVETSLSIMVVHTEYLRLLVYPAALSADYSFDCIPPAQSTSCVCVCVCVCVHECLLYTPMLTMYDASVIWIARV